MANEAEQHRLGVLERGSLDEIAKPPHSRNRAGSRIASSNLNTSSSPSTASRARLRIASSLELLTPEEVMVQSFDLELEDYGGSSEETTEEEEVETGRTSEMFHIAEPLKQPPDVYLSEDSTLTDDDDKQLAIYGSLLREETLVDSDEENSIMKEIRAEITEQIRGEMKSEIEMYKKKREGLSSEQGDVEKEDKSLHLEPELKEAIIKMKKLDKILSRKVKREKEVKRDRILLQKRLHEELRNIKPEGGGKSRDVQANTAKFLALTLPPSHSIGIVLEGLEKQPQTPHPPVTPLFSTQYVEEGSLSKRSDQSKGSDMKSVDGSASGSKLSSASASATSVDGDSSSTYSAGTNSTNLSGKTHGRKKKNFLKRNKELASDAANLIAMTEDEKRRVDNLLINLDVLPVMTDETEESGAPPAEDNPFAVVLADGEGFMPEVNDMSRLEDIDMRLKALMPPEEFEGIVSLSQPRSSRSNESILFTRTGLQVDGEQPLFGDRVLHGTREDRNLQSRLREIENELNTLTSAVEHEMDSPRLTAIQLQDLLDQCALTVRQATNETDALAESQHVDMSESRAALLASPPYLDEDVLQKLLAEARAEIRCTGSQLISTATPGTTGDEQIESLTEDNIQELLKDSRATSRNMLRADTAGSQPQNGVAAAGADDHNGSDISIENEWVITAPAPQHGDLNCRGTGDHSMPGGPTSPGDHPPDTGDHPPFPRPQVNGFAGAVIFGSDSLQLTSLDEAEMAAALAVGRDRPGEHDGHYGAPGPDFYATDGRSARWVPETVHNGERERALEDRRPFLPEIDVKGSLTTQRQTGSVYTPPTCEGTLKDAVQSATASDFGGNLASRDDELTATPHPPSSSRSGSASRPSSGSAGKHRSVVLRKSLD